MSPHIPGSAHAHAAYAPAAHAALLAHTPSTAPKGAAAVEAVIR
ncbi:MAG TPA: hypothetical protein VNY52_04945 [Solirubrobacteraceae bacterium]|jgi:hypothetical protein|nr:hypothetical protein [Solirubrobacteraceae bacterium]